MKKWQWKKRRKNKKRKKRGKEGKIKEGTRGEDKKREKRGEKDKKQPPCLLPQLSLRGSRQRPISNALKCIMPEFLPSPVRAFSWRKLFEGVIAIRANIVNVFYKGYICEEKHYAMVKGKKVYFGP